MKDLSGITVSRCEYKEIDDFLLFAERMQEKRSMVPSAEKEIILRKYRPYEKNSRLLNIFVIKDNGRMVGCSGYIPFKGFFKKKKIQGIIGSDFVIDPAHSKTHGALAAPLFRNYKSLIIDDKLFCLNFPINQKVSRSFKSAQWKEFSYVDVFYHPLLFGIKPRLSVPGVEVKPLKNFDKDMTAFFKNVSGQHEFILNADSDFLNWRYFNDPYVSYSAFMAVKNKKIVGYVIAEKRKQIIEIVDLMVNLENPAVILLLIYNLFDSLEQEKCLKAACYATHRQYVDVLKKGGFFYNRSYECLFFKLSALFSSMSPAAIFNSQSNLYHFNGFTNYLC